MFTVKSPSSKCSRISLRKTSNKSAGPLGHSECRPAGPLPAPAAPPHPQQVWSDARLRIPAALTSLSRAGPARPLLAATLT